MRLGTPEIYRERLNPHRSEHAITRGGSIQGVNTEKPSGFLALDLAAERALLTTRLPELPPQFPNSSLTVHITFEYQR